MIEPRSIDSLRAGDLALLGIPWDEHSSFMRGPAEAPARIRQVLHCGAANLCTEAGVDLAVDRRLVDCGDVDVSTAADARITGAIEAVLERSAKPLILGGDHAITWPVVRGIASSRRGLTILHIDAHPDLYDELDGDRESHACPFARIMEADCCDRLVQLGIRTVNPHQRAQAERFGVEMFEMRHWTPRTLSQLRLQPPLYLSIDLDALDPAYAPGVSHHEPGGFSTRALLDIIQWLPVAPMGADVVELNPRRDHHDMTAMVAGKLVKEIVGKMRGR